jgi:hypothetical protein
VIRSLKNNGGYEATIKAQSMLLHPLMYVMYVMYISFRFIADSFEAKFQSNADQEWGKRECAKLFLNHLIGIGEMNGECIPGQRFEE